MKKITGAEFIINDKLAAFILEGDEINIIHKLLALWNDPEYLFEFYEQNKKIIEKSDFFAYDYDFANFAEEIGNDLEQIETFIEKIADDETTPLDNYFKALSRSEEQIKILSFRKRRCKWLRIYAIRIDENLYAITGGAIKITQKMQGHKDTKNELAQLDYSRMWLKHQGIETHDNFYLYFYL